MKDFSYTKQMQGEKKNEKLSLLVTSALNTLCFSELLWTHFFNPTWPIQPKSRVSNTTLSLGSQLSPLSTLQAQEFKWKLGTKEPREGGSRRSRPRPKAYLSRTSYRWCI